MRVTAQKNLGTCLQAIGPMHDATSMTGAVHHISYAEAVKGSTDGVGAIRSEQVLCHPHPRLSRGRPSGTAARLLGEQRAGGR